MNKRQVVVALSSVELVYFELDLEGQLNKYRDRKAMGSTVLALSIAEVPIVKGRHFWYVLFLTLQRWQILTTVFRPLDVKTGLFESSPWIQKALQRLSVCKH